MTQKREIDVLLKASEVVRTTIDCHGCRELGFPDKFIAKIDHRLNGNHKIQCPRCDHIHYRVVKDGIVTDFRYDSGYPVYDSRVSKIPGTAWKDQDVPIETSTTATFIRSLWLDRT